MVKMPTVIDRFIGQHRFLSNFHPSPMLIRVGKDSDLGREIGRAYVLPSELGGLVSASSNGSGYDVLVPTIEHGFQSDKAATAIEQLVVLRSDTPAMAKSRGRRVRMRDDWEAVKIDVMRRWLRLKFSTPSFRDALLGTIDAELIESNTWNDREWGVCGGCGENKLGRLLMEVRAEIAEKERGG
jgi:ribA/ribD-fused uncharacterized protein